ncbi:MAG: hypothetical protein HKL85_09230 [Acidimicrobiaceae bacterium]|nr:hypothetical protein [Acidimicrobiaceae bacterium]
MSRPPTRSFVTVKLPYQWTAAVKDYRGPTWPDGTVEKQMHLDLAVDGLVAGEVEAIGRGVVRAEFQPAPTTYTVVLDPGGHLFCLRAKIPGRSDGRLATHVMHGESFGPVRGPRAIAGFQSCRALSRATTIRRARVRRRIHQAVSAHWYLCRG